MPQNPFQPHPPPYHASTPSANNGRPGAPSQIPSAQNMMASSVDLSSALDGISPQQLATIAHLIQTGQIPLPPVDPITSQAQRPSAAPTPTSALPPAASRTTTQPPDRDGDVDMDKEEGEVEEGEVEDTPKMRDFLSTPPKGPRNNSRSPRPPLLLVEGDRRGSQLSLPTQTPKSVAPSRKQSTPNEAAFEMNRRNASTESQVNGITQAQTRPKKDAAAKTFILEMHKAGYSFDDLAKEVSKPGALRRLFEDLGLPVQASNRLPDVVPHHASIVHEATEQRKPSLTKRLAPAKSATPQDRSEYLAKLQAAKNKKAESGTAAPPVAKASEQPAVTAEPAKSAVGIKAVSSFKPASPSPAPGKVNVKTELVRQKLDALKAQMALKQSSEGPPSSPMTKPNGITSEAKTTLGPGLGDGLAEAASIAGIEPSKIATRTVQISQQHLPAYPAPSSIPPTPTAQAQHATHSAASASANSRFGLPGLFVSGSAFAPPFQAQSHAPAAQRSSSSASATPNPTQALSERQPTLPPSNMVGSTPTYSPAPVPVLTQRPVAGTSGAPKRPFSLYTSGYADEPFIIVDSDDESDAAMDIEGETTATVDNNASSRPGPLPNFPPKLNMHTASAKSTPGTPGTPAAELKRKEQELEELKRKLADREAQLKSGAAPGPKGATAATPSLMDTVASVAPASVVDTAPAHDATPSGEATVLSSAEGKEPLQPQAVVPDSSDARPLSSGAKSDSSTSRNQEKVRLQDRLIELENQLHGGVPLDGAQEASADDLDEASGDDFDFYDATPGEPDHPPEHMNEKTEQTVGAQATTVSLVTETESQLLDGAVKVDDRDNNRDIGSNAADGVALNESLKSTAQTTNDDGPEEDEGDLDDIYGPSVSEAVSDSNGHAVQATLAAPSEKVAEDDETDDAMDTSEDWSSDSDSSNSHEDGSQNDDSEDDASNDLDLDASGSAEHEADGSMVSNGLEITNNHSVETSGDDSMAVDNDLAPEPQPSEEEPPVPPEESKHSFSSYVSPLSRFRDYRYHPEFDNTVAGGYKSLTYSHHIDAEKRLCPFETAGGICNDKTCGYQHFKTMEVTDNDLLKLMGTHNVPARTDDEKKKWNAGLQALVQELRKTGQGRDVSTIARRIAQYRRDFTGDPSKTLQLDS